jgi:pyruvate formate lyase activating enzyme
LEYTNVTGHIYDIQGYAVHDGPGIRTTVYTKGCPLHCLWCHSPESQYHEFELGYLSVKCIGVELCQNACISACPKGAITAGEAVKALDGSGELQKAVIDRKKCVACLKCTEACITKALYPTGRYTTVDEVFERLQKDRGFFKNGGGVTISGGEAMSQFDFTFNLAKRLKESGIHICLDTTGFAPEEQFRQILPYIDLYLYDIKHMDTVMHRKLTSVGNELILNNARFLAENGGALQIRVPIIPKLTDSDKNLLATAEFCASLNEHSKAAGQGEAVKLVQLLPYHATGRMKYERLGWHYKLKNVQPPPDAFMNKTLELFKSFGLNAQLH